MASFVGVLETPPTPANSRMPARLAAAAQKARAAAALSADVGKNR
jgi:hypothetical protein